jgi:hypothetical protein
MPVVIPPLRAAGRRSESFDLLLFAPTVAGYASKRDQFSDNWKSPRVDPENLRVARYGIVRKEYDYSGNPGCRTFIIFQNDWTGSAKI